MSQNQQRSGFFEKLILLDTGSFALTLTFLSGLGTHVHHSAPPIHLAWMYAGWVCLLFSVILSWVHNFFAFASSVQAHNAATVQTYAVRLKTKSAFMSRFANSIEGSFEYEGTNVDVGNLFKSISGLAVDEFSRQVKSSPTHLKRSSNFVRYAFRLGASAIFCTVLALACILVFAMSTAYIFFLPT